MHQPYLRILTIFRSFPALLAVMCGLWLPAARADVFVSGANTTFSDILSFSQYTGAFKLDMPISGPLPNDTAGMAIGPDGNLYVVNSSKQTVLRFNPVNGAFIGTFVTAGSGLSLPQGITFGPDDNLYVADYITGVRQFNGTTGAPMGAITTNGLGGSLYASDVKFGSDHNLYVGDDNSNNILKYDGSTFAFMGVFATAPAPYADGIVAPQGMAFGPNGNLYIIGEVRDGFTSNYDALFEFDGSTGATSTNFGAITSGGDLAFGADGFIYIPEGQVINRYNPTFGYFQNVFTADSRIHGGYILFGCGACAPPYVLHDPVNLTATQTIRLTVVNGPVRVPPGVPVEAQLGFQNSAGAMVGPSQVVNLNPGQTASLDLEGSSLISSGRIQLQPVVTSLPGTPLGSLQDSVELFTTSSGVGSVFYPGIPTPPVSSIAGPPSFVPQGVARGQSMQINVAAPPDSPCVAMLSFADNSGNPIGPTQQVNLSPGTMASLIFNPNKYTKSGREEYVPQMTPNDPTGGQGVAPACLGSVEVFSQKTGDIATYQTSSPAVGTLTAAP